MKRIIITLCALTIAATVHAQSTTTFRGLPHVKISEAGDDRVAEDIAREKGVNFKCVISEIDGSYYWASRENVQLVRIDGGAFSTFIAVNGSGYIRVVDPDLKEVASLMGDTESKYDYVEHLMLGLRSITYYGVRE